MSTEEERSTISVTMTPERAAELAQQKQGEQQQASGSGEETAPEQQPEEKVELPSDEGKEDQQTQPEEDTRTLFEQAGVDFDKYASEFDQSGELSDEAKKTLTEKVGLPEQYVTDYFEGARARVELTELRTWLYAGGQQEYESLSEWAGANMSEADINAINEDFESLDGERVKSAVERMKSARAEKNGVEGDVVMGDTRSTETGNIYESRQQLADDLRNPKMKTDPAYRAAVNNKIARTQSAGGYKY